MKVRSKEVIADISFQGFEKGCEKRNAIKIAFVGKDGRKEWKIV